MKKIVAIITLFTITLTGCGSQVDYKDPQVYVDYTVEQFDKTFGDDFITSFDEFFTKVGLTKDDKFFETQLTNMANEKSVSDMSDADAKKFYDEFTKSLDESMVEYGDKYKDASSELKETLKNDELLSTYKTQLETVKDQIGNMDVKSLLK